MSDSNDWEIGTFSDEDFEIEKKKRKIQTTTKSLLLNQIVASLLVIRNMNTTIFIDNNIANEPLPLNRIMFINALVKNSEQKLKNALLFRLYILHEIPTRLMIEITENQFRFVEVHTSYEKSTIGKYRGCVFFIDCGGFICDVTFLYGIKIKYYRLFTSLINALDKYGIYEKLHLNFLPNEFFKTDYVNLCNVVPKSLTKIKIHPHYVVESLLHPDQLINPKKPISGYINGEPVFLRSNIVTLETERQLYKKGLKIISQNPFRIIKKGENKLKIYARWQTEKIVKTGFDKGNMDYFHINHIPIDCVYFDDDENGVEVCKLLEIDFRVCCVGFIRKMPIFKGIFIKKEDNEMLQIAVNEYKRCKKIKKENVDMMVYISLWKKLIKKVKLYKKIKERIYY